MDEGYIAGLFDGEGCVYLHLTKTGNLKVIVSITSTNKEVMEKLKNEIGGNVYSKGEQGNRRPGWSWRPAYNRSIPFLRSIVGYLVIKRQIVELAISVFTLKAHGELTPELSNRVIEVARNLNHRGK